MYKKVTTMLTATTEWIGCIPHPQLKKILYNAQVHYTCLYYLIFVTMACTATERTFYLELHNGSVRGSWQIK